MGFKAKVRRNVKDRTATIAVDSKRRDFWWAAAVQPRVHIGHAHRHARRVRGWTFDIDVQGGRRDERPSGGSATAATGGIAKTAMIAARNAMCGS